MRWIRQRKPNVWARARARFYLILSETILNMPCIVELMFDQKLLESTLGDSCNLNTPESTNRQFASTRI